MASHAQTDLANMDLALRMAWRGVGRTGANPSVGAVIVDAITGEIIARGTTAEGGRPHAETQAIARAGERARGATMYVTLEPCSHFGKTPPCADAVVDAGIARVVVGVEDPDLRVSGRGIERLRRAGIEVVTGVLAAECRRATLGHIRRVTLNRPFVQVKLAVGADGLVPHGEGGKPVWVTGPEARAQAHLLRAQADAILIGIGTARADDPDLTCRLPGMAARSPLRVVLDSDFTLSPDSRSVAHCIAGAGDGVYHAGSRPLVNWRMRREVRSKSCPSRAERTIAASICHKSCRCWRGAALPGCWWKVDRPSRGHSSTPVLPTNASS